MYKNFLVLLIIAFLQGCGSQTSSYISSGLTLASGGTTEKVYLQLVPIFI